METKDVRYFLYARRSIEKKDGEEKVASIDSQLDEMVELAKKENLHIVGTFQETKSAKKPGREQFDEMVRQIKLGKANGILVWKIDRLARNPIDEGTIKYLLQEGDVEHIRAHDRDWHSDDHSLIASVEFGTSTQYSRDLSKHVKRGLNARAAAGYRPNMAPIGYTNSKRHEKGNEEVLIDEERFPIVRKLFDLMLTGTYTVPILLKIANDQLKLRMRYRSKHGDRPDKFVTRSNLYSILTNSFYYGDYEYPEHSGSWHEGKHRSMITKEEYDKVQHLLGREGRPRPKSHWFPYTGLMKCECGASITASEKHKKQKNGNAHHYTYYHCTHRVKPCDQPGIRAEELEKQILNFLKEIELPKLFHDWAIATLKEMHEAEVHDRNKLLYQKQVRYNDTKNKLDTLVNFLLEGTITKDVYAEKKTIFERDLGDLKSFLDNIDERIHGWMKKIEEAFNFAADARKEFESGDKEKKRQILSSIGWNHLLKDRKLILQAEKPLSVIQKAISEAKKISDRLEPPKDVGKQRQIQQSYSQNPQLCAGGDSNSHACYGATTSR